MVVAMNNFENFDKSKTLLFFNFSDLNSISFTDSNGNINKYDTQIDYIKNSMNNRTNFNWNHLSNNIYF